MIRKPQWYNGIYHNPKTQRSFLMITILTLLKPEILEQITNKMEKLLSGRNLSDMVTGMIEELDSLGIEILHAISSRMDIDAVARG